MRLSATRGPAATSPASPGAQLPATEAERRERLKGWPTPVDLDDVATAWTAKTDGVRPAVRVLEQPTITRTG